MKRCWKIAFLFGVLAAGFAPGPACRIPPGPPAGFEGEWSPQALLTRSVRAYGGPEAVIDFDDLGFDCRIEVLQDGRRIEGTTRLLFKRPDLIYFISALEEAGERIVLFDGRESLELHDGSPTGRDVSADLERRRRLTMIHAFFLDGSAEGVELIPPQRIEERWHAVLEKSIGGETWKLWIDLEDFLIRRIRLYLPSGDPESGRAGPLSVEWTFRDFREISGRTVPHAFRIHLNGQLFQEGEITGFRLNQGLGAEDFRGGR
jgi:hypothetical protein